jgi:hypothetical protein
MDQQRLVEIERDLREALDRHWAATGEWQPKTSSEYGLKYSRVTFLSDPVNRAIYDGVNGYAEATIQNGEVKNVMFFEEGHQ